MLATDTMAMVAAALVIFAAALVSSIAGFAFSALSAAALVRLLENPVQAVSVMIACSIAIQAYGVWALRGSIEWRLLWPFVAGGAATVPLGVWLLTRIPSQMFAAGLGLFLVVYGLYMLCRGKPPVLGRSPALDALAGALGGLVGGIAGFPGSFVTIWCGMQGWGKERQRALYQPYILIMQLEALACLRLSAPQAMTAEVFLLYMPMALVAACAGLALFRRMSGGQFTLVVHVLLIGSGLSLLGGLL